MGESSTPPQGKRALLVGINAYPNFGPEMQLQGALNDVALVRKLLCERFGFLGDAVKELTNEQAKRDDILAAMQTLVDETQPEDVVVFYYSGHGSSMTDREKDEPDGMDETIIPYDSGRRPNHENRDISDDEIYLWLRDLGAKTGNITLVFDSCHSGGITRNAFGGRKRSVPPDDRPIRDLPLSPIPESEWTALAQANSAKQASGWAPVGSRYVMIAACRDKEEASEYPPQAASAQDIHGCLTYHLHQELTNGGPGTTYRDVFEPARRRVIALYPDQTPQIEGNRDRVLFGLRDLEPARFLSVTERSDRDVTLDGGAAHAVRPQSHWTVYPAGTKKPDGPLAPLGGLEVSSVRGLTCTARIQKESAAGAVVTGARAFELDPRLGADALAVGLGPAPAGFEAAHQLLADRLAKSRKVRLAGPGESAAFLVLLLGPRGQPSPSDPLPALGPVQEASWVVVGGGDRPVTPIKPAKAVDAVRDNLETIARYFQLLSLRNPASTLAKTLDVTLLRSRNGGDWEEARPEADGKPVYLVRDRLAFRVVNRSSTDLYMNVLDFGFTYKVTPIYPPANGANQLLRRRLPFEFGKRAGQTQRIQPIPDWFTLSEGSETLKFIVAYREIDSSWMRQEGVRAVPPTREGAPVAPEDWSTVEVDFVVRRV